MPDLPRVSTADLMASLQISSGNFSPDRLSVYGIFRNEKYFVEAFLDHHRALGVEQFVILDDGSDDGTTEYLSAESDCVVLSSEFAYGQQIVLSEAGADVAMRAGQRMKTAIPRKFFANRWALYLDADEFFFLPPGIPSLRELTARLDMRGDRCVSASLVDFYPDRIDTKGRQAPSTIADLLGEAGYFDATPVVTLLGEQEGKTVAKIEASGASARLFRKYGIGDRNWLLSRLPLPLRKLLRRTIAKAAVMKTPLVRWDTAMEMVGSHHTNLAPSSDTLLTIAHFKFTSDLARRSQAAMIWRSYAKGSQKYEYYEALLDAVARRDGTLLGPDSKRFVGTTDFIGAGLMKVPRDLSP